MLEGLSVGHTQKKQQTLSCLWRSYSRASFFFIFLNPQSNMPGLALISLLCALEEPTWWVAASQHAQVSNVQVKNLDINRSSH